MGLSLPQLGRMARACTLQLLDPGFELGVFGLQAVPLLNELLGVAYDLFRLLIGLAGRGSCAVRCFKGCCCLTAVPSNSGKQSPHSDLSR